MKTRRIVGTILSIGLPLLADSVSGQMLTIICSFTGNGNGRDEASPFGRLVQGNDGNSCATTEYGRVAPRSIV